MKLLAASFAAVLIASSLFVSFAAQDVPKRGPGQAPKGALVIVGGGGTTDAIVQTMIDLGGGLDRRMVILPQASDAADAGEASRKFYAEKGIKTVVVVDTKDEAKALDEIARADIIWMPGGDQKRLMDAVGSTKIPAAIHARYRDGAVVGGTSAGAAVISNVMILGGEKADLASVRHGATEVGTGLGLWPDAIVDQHFLKRQRFNRLLACVLDHPELVGVGIDESTAVVVRGGKCQVVGASAVTVIDARRAKVGETKAGESLSATDVRVHLVRAGESFDLVLPPR